MENISLVVMAAGMGSRFGGLKQLAPVGPNGEIILDFSVYDAVRAGFGKTVFIIKKAIEKDFREVVGKRIEKLCDVDYVFQEVDAIPADIALRAEKSRGVQVTRYFAQRTRFPHRLRLLMRMISTAEAHLKQSASTLETVAAHVWSATNSGILLPRTARFRAVYAMSRAAF